MSHGHRWARSVPAEGALTGTAQALGSAPLVALRAIAAGAPPCRCGIMSETGRVPAGGVGHIPWPSDCREDDMSTS